MRRAALAALLFLAAPAAGAQERVLTARPDSSFAARDRARASFAPRERDFLAQPFRGVSVDSAITPDLFPLRATGVSTAPVRQAAAAFLAALSAEQRGRTSFPVDDDEWRRWMNQHFYERRGVGFGEMGAAQRAAAVGLLRASLSARGLRTSQDIMRLNHTLGELNGDLANYGEGLYWITVMGTPSATEPWGWQLDGHHLVINYFVVGDQVVMTPTFMGSEPVHATTGKYAGTKVLQEEQDAGLAFFRGLTDDQRRQATVASDKRANNTVAEAFRDNVDLTRVGVPATALTAAQRERLVALVGLWVSHMRDGHARVKMAEVRRHLDDTRFAWVGGSGADDVFYYRVQSPVVLIEFDHQRPVALPGFAADRPTRQHIHTVVRTPNGNDYGKDLLRQHLERHPHPHRH
ncbi:DUF3500 domain-containing protein [Roseisolibacter sp. H3M3-2]|uniref:DUF3500 domain-containing protein n=1 Tax=Roseisolibacter sp. H3M3-2 TaxID=3031323 RepID=UPI0023DC81E3|nr:DUF3500 domain-containing protein [Roseisolibacter sp. H3M3-2]MDF1502235.1 DUF3500 domain-containing protein [Roseisolibacter sp. H3M3-2]